MTDHEIIEEQDETAERPFLVGGMLRREFAADLSVGDGRTVDVRIVPYGERITHNDGNHGRGSQYQEEFLPGVFDHQLNAANRVLANIEHDQHGSSTAGYGLMLREAADGFHGTFRLLDTPAGETARQLIEAGALDAVSLEAKEVRTHRTPDGVLQRAKANLLAVAFTRFGAYKGAQVLALREEAEQIIDEELLPVEMENGVVERLRRQGFSVPDRYSAHPAETDTPASAGTPDDGTRLTTEAT